MATTSEKTIANALLSTCHHDIKSLAQSLVTLHSINTLQRLHEDAQTLEAFITIASFAPIILPEATQLEISHLSRPERHLLGDRSDGLAADSSQRSDFVDSSGHTTELQDGRVTLKTPLHFPTFFTPLHLARTRQIALCILSWSISPSMPYTVAPCLWIKTRPCR